MKFQANLMLRLEDMSEKVVNYWMSVYTKTLALYIMQWDCNLWTAVCDLEPLEQVLVKQFKSKLKIQTVLMMLFHIRWENINWRTCHLFFAACARLLHISYTHIPHYRMNNVKQSRSIFDELPYPCYECINNSCVDNTESSRAKTDSPFSVICFNGG